MKINFSSLTFIVFVCLSFISHPIHSQNGTLDPTFGNNGSLSIDLQAPGVVLNDGASAIAITSDNKIIMAGSSYDGAHFHFSAVKLTNNGSLDLSFGNGGKIILPLSENDNQVSSVAIDQNGKILLAGYMTSKETMKRVFVVCRLHPNGYPDFSFGNGGKVAVDIDGSDANVKAMAIDSQNRIILAGTSGTGKFSFTLVRLLPEGEMDLNFSSDGKATYKGTANSYDDVTGVAIDADDNILITGITLTLGPVKADICVLRVLENGGIDNSFNSNGIARIDFGVPDDADKSANSIAIDENNNILVAGYITNGSNSSYALARITSSGILDNSFGNAGKVILSQTGHDNAKALKAVNNKIYVAGNFDNDFGIVVLDNQGDPDLSFNTTGSLPISIGTGKAEAYALDVDINGKLIVAGQAEAGTNKEYAVVRLNAEGTSDLSFGTNGIKEINIGRSANIANDMVEDSEGRMLMAGYSSANGKFQFSIIRMDKDGNLDATFGTNGRTFLALGDRDAYCYTIALDASGRILLGGYSYTDISSTEFYSNFTIARLTANGELDPTFGTNGHIFLPYVNPSTVMDLEVTSDGKILASGIADGKFIVVKLSSDGTLDPSFGNGGKVELGFDAPYNNKVAGSTALKILSDNKILITGTIRDSENYPDVEIQYYGLMQLNSDGSLDNDFGTNGKTVLTSAQNHGQGMDILIDEEQRIILTGQTINPDKTMSSSVVRLLANGSPDNAFGTNGSQIVSIGGQNDEGQRLFFDSKGNIVICGSSFYDKTNHFSMAIVNETGSLNTSVLNDGYAILPGLYDETLTTKLIHTNGSIYLGGYTYGNYVVKKLIYNPDNALPTSITDGIKNTPVVYAMPNPSSDGNFTIQSKEQILQIIVTDMSGKQETVNEPGQTFHTHLKGVLNLSFKTTSQFTRQKVVVY